MDPNGRRAQVTCKTNENATQTLDANDMNAAEYENAKGNGIQTRETKKKKSEMQMEDEKRGRQGDG